MQEQNPAAVPPIRLLQTNGDSVVISLLEKDDDRFLVIVNRDHLYSMKLTLIADYSVKKVQNDGSLISANRYAYSMEVGLGDAVIYTWRKQ
ncbi:MAG: hypothetical protein J0H29_20760 [Sphingobacteriales bacterium]|nr:hypothetical protein [Sphingobacteriales bacterium]OJY84322.1 MAG: hypothetical protein BGP14_18910 [Sphingobacteriales bacterium 44-15]